MNQMAASQDPSLPPVRTPEEQFGYSRMPMTTGGINQAFSTKTFDSIDLVWNSLKLAEISRKHGLPNLAQRYLGEIQDVLLRYDAKGETLKLERFKYTYENFK